MAAHILQVCQSTLSTSLSEVIQRGLTKPCSIWPKNTLAFHRVACHDTIHNDASNIKDSEVVFFFLLHGNPFGVVVLPFSEDF